MILQLKNHKITFFLSKIIYSLKTMQKLLDHLLRCRIARRLVFSLIIVLCLVAHACSYTIKESILINHRESIKIGMKENEVIAILGHPYRITQAPFVGQEVPHHNDCKDCSCPQCLIEKATRCLRYKSKSHELKEKNAYQATWCEFDVYVDKDSTVCCTNYFSYTEAHYTMD